ncbi:MAG: hypothetical protein RR846_07125 [Oscillospiraceae bacterium]
MLKNIDIKEVYLPRIEQEWLETGEQSPSFMEEISKATKEKTEKNLSKQLTELETMAKSSEFNGKELESKLNQLLGQGNGASFMGSMDGETFDAAKGELKAFIRKIRAFAPQMGVEDMGKAARNYLVYAMFNALNDMPQKCTDAIFGYSMLYPVTDNFLDEAGVTSREKLEYNEFIRDKLRGFAPIAKTDHQAVTEKLLDMVEKDYPRQGKTETGLSVEPQNDIYGVLLHMLKAQEESLLQQGAAILSETEIFKISAYKGGISVLADRCFVHKPIAPQEVCFYLGLGLVLQLGDDLQDIGEDIKSGSQTLFTCAKDEKTREKLVNKLLNYTNAVMDAINIGNGKAKEALKNSFLQLILSSVYQSREQFSREYTENLEKYLPVSYSFMAALLEKQNHQDTQETQAGYMAMVDRMLEQ